MELKDTILDAIINSDKDIKDKIQELTDYRSSLIGTEHSQIIFPPCLEYIKQKRSQRYQKNKEKNRDPEAKKQIYRHRALAK